MSIICYICTIEYLFSILNHFITSNIKYPELAVFQIGDVNELFRKRIGISLNQTITFEMLDDILIKIGETIPFENVNVIANQSKSISRDQLINKILVKGEGGLCYELNPLFYFFLIENGFNVSIFSAMVYNREKEDWQRAGRTHVTILLRHNGQTYLIDAGFGANLPLKPVPLSGKVVTSRNGEFRIVKADHSHGDYNLELKLKYKHKKWGIGYSFDSKRPVQDVSEINEIQDIIINHPESPFNKSPLITRLTAKGNITLTDRTFTEWADGKVNKKKIDRKSYKYLAKHHFGLEV